MSKSSKPLTPNSPPSKPKELTPEEKYEKVRDVCLRMQKRLLEIDYPHLLKKKG